MGRGEEAAYTFRCPACDESLEVNAAMKDVLVEKGCVICGTAVTSEAFTDREPS